MERVESALLFPRAIGMGGRASVVWGLLLSSPLLLVDAADIVVDGGHDGGARGGGVTSDGRGGMIERGERRPDNREVRRDREARTRQCCLRSVTEAL